MALALTGKPEVGLLLQFGVLSFGLFEDGNVGDWRFSGLRGEELTETGPAQEFDNAGRHVNEL
jgi:hypothetical protein